MRDTLTPKQLARALDVSQSSVKRWCDKGIIKTETTAGGHRRIELASAMEFIRNGKYELLHPEALGLKPTSGQTVRIVHRACDQVIEALLAGNEALCSQIAIDLYLAEHSLSVICDDLFGSAFRQIGDRWACGQADVYQERRSCEITLRILHKFLAMLPQPAKSAPVAMGCAGAGDQYNLGTTMVEVVLRSADWNASSLGNNLPFETIGAAIAKHRPQLFWLSSSHIVDKAEFLAGYGRLYEEYGMEIPFVVGGFGLTEEVRRQMKYAAYCDTMKHLEAFAQTLRSARENELPRPD